MSIGKTLRIIIWGDNYSNKSTFQQSAAELGHEVVEEYLSVQDVVTSINSNKPDIVLLVCDTVDKNTFSDIKHIQQTCPTPVAVLSENSLDENFSDKLRLSGASYFSAKATDTSEIDKALSIAMACHSTLLELQKMDDRLKMLVRESSHSMKNHLAIITSLMHLQADSYHNTETADALLDCANRVRVIAAIHEVVHHSGNTSIVRLDHFLELIVHKLRQVSPQFSFAVVADEVLMDRESAIHCGLIVNELLTNAIKHAFSEQVTERDIGLQVIKRPDNDMLELSVYDNGSGLPDKINPALTKTFGLQLVSALVDQLGGEMEVDRTCGTRFNIRFKNPVVYV